MFSGETEYSLSYYGRVPRDLEVQVRVLLAEDEWLIRMDLAWILEEQGCEVWEARDAEQALAILEEVRTFDALVTDVDMPGSLDGLTLAFAIRDRLPDCRTLFVSGEKEPTTGEMPEGSLFLSKPVSPATLIAGLRT
ncbi:response regulator [Silicimonas algicola]|uniref:Response regulator receiver domain-containing protein n=1 Tax=Silicimonas algicola TaxID=1826607 RepID=A0A316FZI2_9RHOB|nr:response regulator [Silicimonas algicola]AZQ68365.1 response regulator [Silicimonas algicola]PWK53555.1 response regulator receiver domain-containing protein [Silicimonas algicola]